MNVDVTVLKKEVKKTRKKASTPVPNAPVMVISRVNRADGSSVEYARINPNSLVDFARDNNLDIRACESIINRTYVNHEGFTFRVLPMAEIEGGSV